MFEAIPKIMASCGKTMVHGGWMFITLVRTLCTSAAAIAYMIMIIIQIMFGSFALYMITTGGRTQNELLVQNGHTFGPLFGYGSVVICMTAIVFYVAMLFAGMLYEISNNSGGGSEKPGDLYGMVWRDTMYDIFSGLNTVTTGLIVCFAGLIISINASDALLVNVGILIVCSGFVIMPTYHLLINVRKALGVYSPAVMISGLRKLKFMIINELPKYNRIKRGG